MMELLRKQVDSLFNDEWWRVRSLTVGFQGVDEERCIVHATYPGAAKHQLIHISSLELQRVAEGVGIDAKIEQVIGGKALTLPSHRRSAFMQALEQDGISLTDDRTASALRQE